MELDCLSNPLSVYFRIDMPFIFFYGNIQPVKLMIIDIRENPLSIFIINIGEYNHILLFFCFEPEYFASVAIGLSLIHISTQAGRGSFVSLKNKEIVREELYRQIEEMMQKAVNTAQTANISKQELIEILDLCYEEVS